MKYWILFPLWDSENPVLGYKLHQIMHVMLQHRAPQFVVAAHSYSGYQNGVWGPPVGPNINLRGHKIIKGIVKEHISC